MASETCRSDLHQKHKCTIATVCTRQDDRQQRRTSSHTVADPASYKTKDPSRISHIVEEPASYKGDLHRTRRGTHRILHPRRTSYTIENPASCKGDLHRTRRGTHRIAHPISYTVKNPTISKGDLHRIGRGTHRLAYQSSYTKEDPGEIKQRGNLHRISRHTRTSGDYSEREREHQRRSRLGTKTRGSSKEGYLSEGQQLRSKVEIP